MIPLWSAIIAGLLPEQTGTYSQRDFILHDIISLILLGGFIYLFDS